MKEDLRENVFELLTQIAGQNNILTIPRLFIDIMGDIDGALLFSQLLYWHGKGNNPDGWIYKTMKEWEEETSLSEYRVNKARRKMEKMGILETTVKKAINGSPTVHYRLIEEAIPKLLRFGNLKNLGKETEETSETINIDHIINHTRDFALQASESEDSRYSTGEDFIGYTQSLFNDRKYKSVYRGRDRASP